MAINSKVYPKGPGLPGLAQEILCRGYTPLRFPYLNPDLLPGSDSREMFFLTGLNGVGDCKGLVRAGKFDPPDWTKFNEKSQSISLGKDICVRLFEHDCDWITRGKILDTNPNCTWVSNFALAGLNGIVSAVQIIECPPSPLVSLYAGTNQQGEKIDLTKLQKIGDYEELWNPKGYNVIISEHLRRFDNKAKSIKIKDGVCVRIFEHDFAWTVKGKTLDTMSHSPWVSDFGLAGFNGIISAVKIIPCPTDSGVQPPVTLFAANDNLGESLELYELEKIGDCVEFSNSRGYNVIISEHLRRFDNKARSIKLREGVCVRLFEHDCDWKTKGKILDTTANSYFASDFSLAGLQGMISAVQLIQCPPDGEPLISLYGGIYFTGERVDLHELKKVGDCEDLWSPFGMNVMISENRRRLDNKVNSIKIKDGVCVRLHEHACGSIGRTLDTTSKSHWASDLFKGTFNTILTGIEIIECPLPSRVTAYNSKKFQGTALELSGLQEVGDCIEFWNPGGMDATISDDFRQFNDKMHSIKISPGLCVSLHEGHCGAPGRTLENLRFDSPYARNLNRVSFSAKVTSVELTCDESPPPPPTVSPDNCNCTCDMDSDNDIIPSSRTFEYTIQNEEGTPNEPSHTTTYPRLIPDSPAAKIIDFLKCANITETMIEETGAVYQYHIHGNWTVDFYLDFSNPPGKIDFGKLAQDVPDVLLEIKDADFVKTFEDLTNETFLSWRRAHSVVNGNTYQALSLYTALRKLMEDYTIVNKPKHC